MTDELERAKSTLQNNLPAPASDGAKKRAMMNAMAAFDAEFEERQEEKFEKKIITDQEIPFGVRLINRAKEIGTTVLTWSPPMKNFYPIAGTALAGVFTLSLISVGLYQYMDNEISYSFSRSFSESAGDDEMAKPSDIIVSKPQPTAEQKAIAKSIKRGPSPGQMGDAKKEAARPILAEVKSKPKPQRKLRADKRSLPLGMQGMLSDGSYRNRNSAHGFAAKPNQINMFAGGRIARPTQEASPRSYEAQGRDKFEVFETNPVRKTSEKPVSTFSIDVDTASYSFVRSSLNRNVLPNKNAVRVEELINYFDYQYQAPTSKDTPFKANMSVFPTPWNKETKLLHIGIKGYELPKDERPDANLVFLIDTSGSMRTSNKLPLLVNSFKLLVANLRTTDTVAIVTYAGSAGTVLEPTKIKDKRKILTALDKLRSGGSTAGGEGIRQAYLLAEQHKKEDGVNRVILATDGDFNVGIRNHNELKSYVERKRKTGISLSVLGFGSGNYNDQLMQTLAQNGNGNAAYIDTLNEARKVLVEQAGGTLFTIAKDVKIQVEFNPATVSEYRLIGYETRKLTREDFNNDKVDAGEIGAGHAVTAIYEITPKGSSAQKIDDLRYGQPEAEKPKAETASATDEYAFVKIRYKQPDGDKSTLITTAVTKAMEFDSLEVAPADSRFAAAVAAYGQMLKGGQHTGTYSYDALIELARKAKGDDEFGYRAEFINLVRLTKSAAALEPLKK